MFLIKLIQEGGMVMYPLLICSILVWAIAFERVWTYVKFQKELGLFPAKARQLLDQSKTHEAKAVFVSASPLVARPFEAAFNKIDTGDKKKEVLQRRIQETDLGLRKYLWILATVASSSPFIGLFGTVVGIIKSFSSISTAGKGGFTVVSHDLSEALIATAAGIFVAICSSLLYNILSTWLTRAKAGLRIELEDFMDVVEIKDR